MELLERAVVLDVIEAELRRAAAGRGRVVAVTGPAGIGKTAMVTAFLTDRCSGARVLSAVFDDLSVPRPLGPLLDLAPAFGQDLRQALAGDHDTGRLFPLVVEELGRPPRPVVLVLDDLQWADQATLDLLVYTARRIGRVPVLVLLSSRDMTGTGLGRVLAAAGTDTTTRLELEPLSLAAVRELVGARADDVHARTGGVPFYVHALRHADPGTTPGSVRDGVLAQLAVMSDTGRELLELLSVDPSGIAATELDDVVANWEPHLAIAEEAGLVVHSGGVFAFTHDLVREALVETLPAARRRRLHSRILGALGDDTDVVRVVHHARGAGDVERLLPASLTAARMARRVHAHEQALAHYGLVAPHLHRLANDTDRADALEEHAEEWLAAGQLQRAAATMADAIRVTEEVHDVPAQGRLLARMAGIQAQLGHPGEEREALDRAFGLLETRGPGVELAQACIHRAAHHLDGWDVRAGLLDAERGLELAEAIGDDDLRAYAMIMVGATQAAVHQEVGMAMMSAAASLAADIGHAGLVDIARSERIEVLLDQHRLEAAKTTLDRALGDAQLHEHHGIHARLIMQRSRLLLHRGDLHGALATATKAAQTTSASPLVRWQARLQSAWARLRLGDSAAAAAVEDVSTAARDLAVRFRARALLLDAECGWLHGRPVDVEPLTAVHALAVAAGRDWIAGDLARWMGHHGAAGSVDTPVMAPFDDVIAGRAEAAVTAWMQRGDPYEAAMAAHGSSDPDVLMEALTRADALDAGALGQLLRDTLRARGVTRLPRGPQPATRQNPAGLTPRQGEVLGHLTRGLTNREIAEELVLSERTVEHHVSAILAKLGVTSRNEAAIAAGSLGLSDSPAAT